VNDELLYQILPDASSRDAIETYQDPAYVVFELHTMGEFLGSPTVNSCNFVSVDKDSQQMRVHVDLQPDDLETWQYIDETTFQIADVLADGRAIEYRHPDGSWKAARPDSVRNKGAVHESGTLWMGESPTNSVTDLNGRLHDLSNVYGTGSMLFPRPGSWNPTYTGVAMAFALAQKLS
jgi:choline dehydrogenase-like flavoprotein